MAKYTNYTLYAHSDDMRIENGNEYGWVEGDLGSCSTEVRNEEFLYYVQTYSGLTDSLQDLFDKGLAWEQDGGLFFKATVDSKYPTYHLKHEVYVEVRPV